LVALLWLLPACQVRLPVTRWTGDASSEDAGPVDGKPITVDTGQPVTVPGLAVLTDTNRDGVVDGRDLQDFLDWSWKGSGAFLLANLDDDDRKGAVDTSDLIVNGRQDEDDLAPIVIQLDQEILSKTIDVVVAVALGQERTHLFQKTSGGWVLASGVLSERSARMVLGIEALQFADVDWDGFVVVSVEVLGPRQSNLASAQVKMRVAPWLGQPNSAKTERLYISSTTSRLRPDLNKVLTSAGLPEALASSPPGQDLWFQDTMEVGYTQLPGRPPMHVALNARRFDTADNLAITLLAPDFGFVSVGQPRAPANDLDYWMDWTGNIEMTPPVTGYPLGRILYGTNQRTTFHPSTLQFLEAQEVQKPLAVSVDWLPMQLVDQLVTFVPGKKGEAKLLVASLTAAQAITGTSLDSFKQQMQRGLDDVTSSLKGQLGLSDEDVIPLPASFAGIGADYSSVWSNPVDAVYINGTLVVGATGTPANLKADIEKRLNAIGVRVAWVEDSEYADWVGYVRSATNTSRTPLCANFADCLP
jgi:protein-arginine deiminase